MDNEVTTIYGEQITKRQWGFFIFILLLLFITPFFLHTYMNTGELVDIDSSDDFVILIDSLRTV